MLGRFSFQLLRKISNKEIRICNSSRSYSRKVGSNSNGPYKIVKHERPETKDNSNLVWRDPNFELLASNGFPLFLRGNIGIAWYDSQTTIKTHHELIMEQLEDAADINDGNMMCRVQMCPTVLRETVKDLFPYRTLEDHSELSVVTITLKPNVKDMRKNKELETERLAQLFLIAAKNICDKLRASGYWADFINPYSGRPYFTPSSLGELYQTDEKFRCLDFQIIEIKDCKVISTESNAQKQFIGSLFTSAPCKKNKLNSIFT
ncbi:cobalamin trafficking protein CblD [Leptinotarsa decemlineata]|uniref:cobalamin trafficking protein CblD n=1 Tax=Leptinotarsa decemlineata TaxID=7539 RepID=UPI000C2528C6|nr:methylmalonic aciduria and homocystinuria type D homolog, mitochondrial-like [Leptinotarsa decemlineata]